MSRRSGRRCFWGCQAASTEAHHQEMARVVRALGVPVAYLHADNSDLAEVILAFGLLPEREQHRLAMELKARVSPPATKVRPARRAPAARRPR